MFVEVIRIHDEHLEAGCYEPTAAVSPAPPPPSTSACVARSSSGERLADIAAAQQGVRQSATP
jgi:hypothetical protein